jgi:imidazolonepropionase-like amidohydrolase
MSVRRLSLLLPFATLCLAGTGGGPAVASSPAASAMPAAAAPTAPASPPPAATHAVDAGDAGTAADLAAARALFETNIRAIHQRNRAAYLACYDDPARVPVGGAEGLQVGGLVATRASGASADDNWPDNLEAMDLHLAAVRPGLVYGTYRFRVRYGAVEQAGVSERLFVRTAAGWKIAVTTAFYEAGGVPAPARALTGATLVDGTGAPPVRGAVVLLRDGRIECAGTATACPLPPGTDVLDLAGMWITPGVIDAHVHFSQTGWADGRPDSIDVRPRHPYLEVEAGLRQHPERFGRTYLCSGVTSVFDVGGYPWTLGLPARSEPDSTVPRITAAGPLISTLDHWLNLPGERQFLYLRDEAAGREGVDYLADQGAAAIKVWFIPSKPIPELEPLVRAAADEAHRRKLPLIVHATGLAEAKAALRAGARMLVHSVWDLPVDQEFLDLARAQGTLYCPTLTVIRGYQRMYEASAAHRAPAVDDPNGCVDPETLARVAETATLAEIDKPRPAEELTASGARTAAREKTMAANLMRVAAAGIPIVMGTDAGNPLTLHGVSVYAEMEAMQRAGMAPRDVLLAATRGGAAALGRGQELGTVEKGKLADLLVVAADPLADIANLRRLRYVVRGGVVRSLAELHALAATGPAPPAAAK